MIDYTFGNYGFLKQGKMENPPLFLLDLGIERRCREDYHFENAGRVSYGGYLLQFTLKGCGIYEANSQKHKLTPGWGFFSKIPENSRYYLPPSDISPKDSVLRHSSISHDLHVSLKDTVSREIEDDGWEFFYLHFDGPSAQPFFETVRTLSGPVFHLPLTSPPVALFFRLTDRLKNRENLALYEGGEFLYRFFAQLLRELETPSTEGSPLVQQAAAYFKNHFSELKGIGEAAEVCNVSQAHLTRIFHEETGQTPLQYLTRLRVEHGLFLLLSTKDSIENIASACGFLNGNYFAKVFRRYLNCSPEEYRKRNR